MAKKSKKKKGENGLVFSTDESQYTRFSDLLGGLDLGDEGGGTGDLRVWIDRKGRGGKTVTIVKGWTGSEDQLTDLAKSLKVSCGVGGAAKDGEIILQGNCRDKCLAHLKKLGHKAKAAGS